MALHPPKFPLYGYKNTSLIFPVVIEIARLDRVENRVETNVGGEPGFDDVFSEHVRYPDGTKPLHYLPSVKVLAQYIPPSATEHAGRGVENVNNLEISFRVSYLLSTKDLTEKGLIDPVSKRILFQQGDVLLAVYSVDELGGGLMETFNQSKVTLKEVHPIMGGYEKRLYRTKWEDISQGSPFLS